MICPYCGNETGNKVVCSYCGHKVYDNPQNGNYYVDMSEDATVPSRGQNGLMVDPEVKRHLRNIDTWGLMSLVLLGGIFILELLRFVLSFV